MPGIGFWKYDDAGYGTPEQAGKAWQAAPDPITSPAQQVTAGDYARHLQAYQERYEGEKRRKLREHTVQGQLSNVIAGAGEEFSSGLKGVSSAVATGVAQAASKAESVAEQAWQFAKEEVVDKPLKRIKSAPEETLEKISSAAGGAADQWEARADEVLRQIRGLGGSVQAKIDATERLLAGLPDRIKDEILAQLKEDGALWKKIVEVLKGLKTSSEIQDPRTPVPAPQYITVLGGWGPFMRGGAEEEYGRPRWGRGDRVRGPREGWSSVAGRIGVGYEGVRTGTGVRNLASFWGM